MAKKITKEPTIRRYKATCPICGCEFEFDTTDAYWYVCEESKSDYYGIQTLLQTVINCEVVCPTCNTTLSNKQTEIEE